MVISNTHNIIFYKKHLGTALKGVQLFRIFNAFIACFFLLIASNIFAQNQFDFELAKNIVSPSKGQKLFGYTGTVHYSFSEKLGISVATGYMKIEESNTYFRDQKNSLVNYENVTDLKIIPLIFAGRYNLLSIGRLETFCEAESGLNLLIFEESINSKFSRNHEIHLGIGLGGGANLVITDYFRLVMKCKLNVATKIGNEALFHERSRYVTFSTGFQVGL